MGAIVAVTDKQGKTAVEKALDMLKALTHRFNHLYGIATENSIFIAKNHAELISEIPEASAAIGYGLCKIKPEDEPQPTLEENFAFALEGRFFPQQSPSDLKYAINLLKKGVSEKTKELIGKIDGSYNLAVLHRRKILVGRDPSGTRPLYYGENSKFAAVASEIKALRKLGIEGKSFPPGTIAAISSEGFIFEKVRKPPKATLRDITEGEAAEIIQESLLEAIRERIADLDKFAIAFSRGLDSGILALLAKKCGFTPQLISVGLEGKKEIEEAVSSAEELGLPIKIRVFNEKEIKDIIPKVLWIIEEPDPIKLSIAIPLFFAAETTSKNDLKVILAGQGSDELFAGYKKYLQVFSEKGEEALHEALRRDFLNCYKTNFERDEKVCAFHKLELRLPFADWELANFALSLPPRLKISLESGQRKVILRKAAEKLGLPASIAYRPKRAIQYATGVTSTLRKIAKRKGLSLQKYVEKIFTKIRIEGEKYEENGHNL